MNYEGTPEPIDFDFFDEDPSSKASSSSNYREQKPTLPRSGKRSDRARANDGEYDQESVRSVTSSRSSVSVRIPTATPTHDDGNDADYYSDDFDESEDKEKEKDSETFRFKDDIRALKNNGKSSDAKRDDFYERENQSAGRSRPRPKTSRARNRRQRSDSSSSNSSTDSASASFSSESSTRSRSRSISDSDRDDMTEVSPLQSPSSSPIPKLEYDEQEMERECEKLRSVRFEQDEMDRSHPRDSSRKSKKFDDGKSRPKSAKYRDRPDKTPGYSNYPDRDLRETEANELSMLLKAVLEMDESSKSSDLDGMHKNLRRPVSGKRKNRPQSAPMPHQRMNMSFSNDEVKRIDRENRRLLDKIIAEPSQVPAPPPTRSRAANHRSYINPNLQTQRPSSHAAVRRQRDQRRIEIENLQILKRIEAARANPQVKKESLMKDYSKQMQYATQVSKTPGGHGGVRPHSAKRAGKSYRGEGMSKASSMTSLGTDYTADTATSSSTHRSRPGSAKWSGYGDPRPAWDDRFHLE